MLVDKAINMMATDKWPEGGQIACNQPLKGLPILFPDDFVHAVVFEKLKETYPGLEVVSAGFCELNEDGWFCEGRSSSLGINSHGIDASTINDEVFKSLKE
jgi:hypothetical protein